jgi:hypothetical protein
MIKSQNGKGRVITTFKGEYKSTKKQIYSGCF